MKNGWLFHIAILRVLFASVTKNWLYGKHSSIPPHISNWQFQFPWIPAKTVVLFNDFLLFNIFLKGLVIADHNNNYTYGKRLRFLRILSIPAKNIRRYLPFHQTPIHLNLYFVTVRIDFEYIDKHPTNLICLVTILKSKNGLQTNYSC